MHDVVVAFALGPLEGALGVGSGCFGEEELTDGIVKKVFAAQSFFQLWRDVFSGVMPDVIWLRASETREEIDANGFLKFVAFNHCKQSDEGNERREHVGVYGRLG